MTEQKVEEYPPDPKFITYLLSQEHQHDCYFVVGNISIEKPERLGVVKKMLMAHSPVLRTQIEESKLAEKGDIPVTDLYPHTFKNLLKYVYGYDNISALCFDDADNLLYAAEKYLMQELKDKLAVRLIALLNTDNICSLFDNRAIFTVLELNSAFTKILQNETDKVLASPFFLDLSPDAFTKILEQDALNVPEVEVWKAAVKWAKHRTGSEDGQILRKELSKPSQHIRICTLSHENFNQEVVPARVLTYDEVVSVCLYHTKRKVPEDLGGFSLETVCRKIIKSRQCEMSFSQHNETTDKTESSFEILTKKSKLELLSIRFAANSLLSYGSMVPENPTYLSNCTIEVARVTNYEDKTSTEIPTKVGFFKYVKYGKDFVIPCQCVLLQPNQLYKVNVKFTQSNKMYRSTSASPYANEHCSVGNFKSESVCNFITGKYQTMYICPMRSLLYRPC